jgi:hypothetical protein
MQISKKWFILNLIFFFDDLQYPLKYVFQNFLILNFSY